VNDPYGDGARYDPAEDTWRAVTNEGAPSSRALAGAVWTGDEMIVWGGAGCSTPDCWGTRHSLSDGARYRPADDIWTPMSNDLDDRLGHAMVWTGAEVLVWGGFWFVEGVGPGAGGWNPDTYGVRGDGARYDPATDVWTPLAAAGAPEARWPYGLWTGDALLLWGGWAPTRYYEPPVQGGARYDSTTDAWAPIASDNEPEERIYPTVIWTGEEMLVWGGHDRMRPLPSESGSYYDFSWLNLASGGRYVP
jgi:hypothetical protein